MPNPDQTRLDAIDQIWDAHVRGENTLSVLDTDGYAETIEALHMADTNIEPSDSVRRRLRSHLFDDSAGGCRRTERSGVMSNAAADELTRPSEGRTRQPENDELTARRWWISHATELAAIVLILVVAIAAAAIWQSDGGNGTGEVEPEPGVADSGDPRADTAEDNAEQSTFTFEEAQKSTPFDLIMPAYLPDGYELEQLGVGGSVVGYDGVIASMTPGDDWIRADFFFVHQRDHSRPIQLIQANRDLSVSEQPTGWESEQLSIDGVEVTRTRRSGDEPLLTYTWTQDDVGMQLVTAIEPETGDDGSQIEPVDPGDLERIARSIIEQRSTQDDSVPEGEVPTPDAAGTYANLSFEQAQEVTPFELIDPRRMLEGYEIPAVSVMGPPEIDRGNGEGPQPVGNRYEAMFGVQSTEAEGRSIQLSQVNMELVPPSISGDTYVIGPDGERIETDVPEPTQEEIEIDGLPVIHTVQHNSDGNMITSYTWHQDGVGLMAFAMIDIREDHEHLEPAHAVPSEDIEAFVSAIIESRQSDATPAASETE